MLRVKRGRKHFILGNALCSKFIRALLPVEELNNSLCYLTVDYLANNFLADKFSFYKNIAEFRLVFFLFFQGCLKIALTDKSPLKQNLAEPVVIYPSLRFRTYY